MLAEFDLWAVQVHIISKTEYCSSSPWLWLKAKLHSVPLQKSNSSFYLILPCHDLIQNLECLRLHVYALLSNQFCPKKYTAFVGVKNTVHHYISHQCVLIIETLPGNWRYILEKQQPALQHTSQHPSSCSKLKFSKLKCSKLKYFKLWDRWPPQAYKYLKDLNIWNEKKAALCTDSSSTLSWHFNKHFSCWIGQGDVKSCCQVHWQPNN